MNNIRFKLLKLWGRDSELSFASALTPLTKPRHIDPPVCILSALLVRTSAVNSKVEQSKPIIWTLALAATDCQPRRHRREGSGLGEQEYDNDNPNPNPIITKPLFRTGLLEPLHGSRALPLPLGLVGFGLWLGLQTW